MSEEDDETSSKSLPENPTPAQVAAEVTGESTGGDPFDATRERIKQQAAALGAPDMKVQFVEKPNPILGDAEAERQLAELSEICPPTEHLLALRCPCGVVMGVGVPKTEYAAPDGARKLAITSASYLMNLFADHLELLAERIRRTDARRAATPGGKGVPTTDEIIARYHNQPCALRIPAEQTVEESANNDDFVPEQVLPPEGGPITPPATNDPVPA